MAAQSDHGQKKLYGHPPYEPFNYPPPQPAPGYGPAMGYPPPMGYHQQGYQQGYPPAPYPPTAYNYPYQQQQQKVDDRASKFVCGVFIGIIFLVLFMASLSIISWVAVRPKLPVVHMNNFVVTNFNISKGIFIGTFEANITVENPDNRFKLFLNEMSNFVSYKDHMLATTTQEPFFVDKKTNGVIDAKITRNDTNNLLMILAYEDMENMSKDRSTGEMVFNYKFVSLASFKSESWWPRHSILKVYCDDLNVQFGNDNVGSMTGGKDCSVGKR